MSTQRSAFSLIEMVIVMVIMAIAAVVAIPMMSSAGTVQLRSAANMIAADLEYAKSMAISRQKTYSVVFDKNVESYQIEDSSGIITHPVKKGFSYIINFKNDSRLSKVDILNVNFAGVSKVSFDYLGSPDNTGYVDIKAAGSTIRISVEAATGYITITNL